VVVELLARGERTLSDEASSPRLPLGPEAHVPIWQHYAAEAATRGAWRTLREHFEQLLFPVQAGISQTEAYRAATRRGVLPGDSSGLILCSPEELRLWLHDGPAGPIPVLCTSHREDFVLLVQALTCRNEPEPVPDSMGACLVSGFNNHDRLRQYRRHWLSANPHADPEQAWAIELRRILPHRELYQDRFLILWAGPYSKVDAAEMGLPAPDWLRLSHIIRLAHEYAHYLALRVFGTVLDHPADEVIADYAGIATACGRYCADWFLRFVGLESFPNYRLGARLENYRGDPPLSDAAFRVLQALVHAAASNLERFDADHFRGEREGMDRTLLVPALSRLSLEELASPDGFTLG
jgi:hypothetical protein